jgi:LuxR family maltose regulon positive regulatory protein
LTILHHLLPEAHAAGRGYTTFQIRLLLAQAYAIRKQSAEARQILIEGLEQGYAGGFQRSFLDEGDQLFLLLHDLFPRLQHPPIQEYVQTLFRAFRQVRRETRISPEIQTPFEPLSKQEQRVLRLLVAGRSNQEIAQELVVSINTIRTQVQSIYRKLQVNNRQAASEIARNLNLL